MTSLKSSHRKIVIVAALLSLAIHILPMSFLVFSKSPRRPDVKDSASLPLEITFSEENVDRVSSSPSQRQIKAIKKSKRVVTSDILNGGFRKSSIAALLTSKDNEAVAIQSGPQPSGDPMKLVGAGGHGWSGAVQYGNAMDLPFTLETLSYFQALYARINGVLTYPDDIARQRITGIVRIEAELAKDGRLLQFVSSTANDQILQAYCFAILVHVLDRPLHHSQWLATDRAIVSFEFDFRTRIPMQTASTFPTEIQKNHLVFGRENEIDPWLNEKLHEVFTRYVPPIIPIPGGFYVDLVSAYGYVQNLIDPQPTEREPREARIGKLHEVLKQTLRQFGVEPLPAPTPDTRVNPDS